MAIFMAGFLFGRTGLPADETNPPPAAAADNEKPAEISQGRDPFWPIGYSPSALTPGPAPAGPETAKTLPGTRAGLSEILRIRGVVKRGNRFYANINGFTVQTGEVVFAVSAGDVYKFLVEGIDFQKVQLRPLPK